MRIKLVSPDIIGGAIAIVLGILSIYESIRLYPYSQRLLTGDHTFPGLLGILLVIGGAILIFKQKRRAENQSTLPKGRTGVIMLVTIGILFIYCLFIEFIGYFISTLLAFVFLIKFIGNYRWVFTIIMAAVLTTVLYLLFIVLLKTPFPSVNLPF